MAEILSPQVVENLNRNIDDIDKTLNTKGKIKPLWGPEFYTLPTAIQMVIETGGFEPFATETALKASTPTLTKKAAYALNTHKIWLWNNGQWIDTGLSALDKAIEYTDSINRKKIDGEFGKNLFDKSKVTTGKFINETGSLISNKDYSYSDFIEVLPNIAYTATYVINLAYYDQNKNFISIVTASPLVSTENLVTPANASYVRLSIANTVINSVQFERGARTSYESFRINLKKDTVATNNIQDGAVDGSKIKEQSITPNHFKDAIWANMFDNSDPNIILNGYFNFNDGVTFLSSTAYMMSGWIPCKPLYQYSVYGNARMYFYDENKKFLSSVPRSVTFTTPENTAYMRFAISANVRDLFQLNEGDTLKTVQARTFALPGLSVNPETKIQVIDKLAKKYTFADAWTAWTNGEKFPICFLGDSTTEGVGTTSNGYRPLPYDYSLDLIAEKSYSSVLEQLIRSATNNNVARVYNAGFSGQASAFAVSNIDRIMGSAYADTKMLGISFGINDRLQSPATYFNYHKTNVEKLIVWALNKGIQPFLVTTQPTTIPSQVGSERGTDIEEFANAAKRELSLKYDLELIDVNKFGQIFMQHSQYPLLNGIMQYNSNTIHFGDIGHKYTAELIFAHFCKRAIWVNDNEILDFATQRMRSDVYSKQLQQINPLKQGFKLELNTQQEVESDILLQDIYVFNASRKQMKLTAYYANAVNGQYVKLNGVQSAIVEQAQVIGNLDLGLHRIQAFSGATTHLDWLGFKLMP